MLKLKLVLSLLNKLNKLFALPNNCLDVKTEKIRFDVLFFKMNVRLVEKSIEEF